MIAYIIRRITFLVLLLTLYNPSFAQRSKEQNTDIAVLPVYLANFTLQSDQPQKVHVQWETNSEINNDYFEILASTDGTTFIKVAKVSAATKNGNSFDTLKYNYTLDLSSQLLGGLGLLGLLLLPAVGNKIMRILVVLLMVTAMVSCTKKSNMNIPINILLGKNTSTNRIVYIKLVQVDKNGTTTYLGLKSIKL